MLKVTKLYRAIRAIQEGLFNENNKPVGYHMGDHMGDQGCYGYLRKAIRRYSEMIPQGTCLQPRMLTLIRWTVPLRTPGHPKR